MNTETNLSAKGAESDDLSGERVGRYLALVFLLISVLIQVNNVIGTSLVVQW